MKRYTYRLLKQLRKNNDVRKYKEQIANVVHAFGGKSVRVFRSGYSFEWPYSTELTNAQKRELGVQIAAIPGLGAIAITYYYHYKNRKVGKSVQLFRIDEKMPRNKKVS